MLAAVFFTLIALVVVWCVFSQYRNLWIHHMRMQLINEGDYDAVKRMPSQEHQVFFQPFRWDYSEYKTKQCP